MLRFYMNRELAESLGIPLSRWKRWSREFLPPDPLGGLQSGYARQYNLREAFAVYLAGYLVSVMGFSIPQARVILHDLSGWLKKNVIDRVEATPDHTWQPSRGILRIDIMILPVGVQAAPAFTYRIRSMVERRQMTSHAGPELWHEQWTEQDLKPTGIKGWGSYPSFARWLEVSTVAAHFCGRMAAKND